MSPRVPLITFLVLALGLTVFFLLPIPSQAELPTVKTDAPNCTLGSCPAAISFKDNNRVLTYPLNNKITVILNDGDQPRAELKCVPAGIIEPLAIAPPASYPFYAVKFKILSRGTCVLESGNFAVNITGARFR